MKNLLALLLYVTLFIFSSCNENSFETDINPDELSYSDDYKDVIVEYTTLEELNLVMRQNGLEEFNEKE